ncbi:putative acetyltransferase [Pseudocercospora fuligena]|uniref:Putative acetyltransferase n=1 Tax=Pseudocercospora fuligena TaxID=685502 RepID=A0A8H6VK56_9PEZI|nr:putative acetyltransferase [Pseudocercospora fuligena]
MLQTRLIRPDRVGAVDLRADSPMREETSILNGSTLNGGRPPGLPKPFTETSANGFTAVNGDVHRNNTSFRPEESTARPITLPPVEYRSNGIAEQSHPPAPYQSHGWRPTETRPSTEQNAERPVGSPETNKRKRAESPRSHLREDVRDGAAFGTTPQSPKRRVTTHNGGMPSPGPTYSDDHDQEGLRDPQTGNYVREPSPVHRVEARTPPPRPRPEVAAALAQSVQQQFGSGHAASRSDSPPDEQDDRQQSQPYASEQAQDGDNDPKKGRKRNFSNRTKTGCHTCRARKKKCDETKPTCNNCMRGSFQCAGYGPKPPGGTKLTTGRAVVPLQAKHQHESMTVHPAYFDGPYHEAHPRSLPPYHGERFALPRPDAQEPLPHRYGGPIPPIDSRPPHEREAWPVNPPRWHSGPEHPAHSILHQRLPPADYSGVPPPPPPSFAPIPPPPPAAADPWLPHLHPPPASWTRPRTSAATVITTHESVSSGSGSGGSHQGQVMLPVGKDLPQGTRYTTQMDMIMGRKYKPFMDDTLRRDRQSCRQAVESWNDSCAVSRNIAPSEQERMFRAIQDPSHRSHSQQIKWDGPRGQCGHHTFVDYPFSCDYGYNIILGDYVVVGKNCYMQDASQVIIGSRSIIGPNVKFYCMTASVDANQRSGLEGDFMAGPIKVEEDVFIGADCVILPFRTIGKGAVVGAGSVVTRDVKPYTVVAGNPAKPVRKRKIEPGPNADRHEDDIQEQNDEMLRKLRSDELLPKE